MEEQNTKEKKHPHFPNIYHFPFFSLEVVNPGSSTDIYSKTLFNKTILWAEKGWKS